MSVSGHEPGLPAPPAEAQLPPPLPPPPAPPFACVYVHATLSIQIGVASQHTPCSRAAAPSPNADYPHPLLSCCHPIFLHRLSSHLILTLTLALALTLNPSILPIFSYTPYLSYPSSHADCSHSHSPLPSPLYPHTHTQPLDPTCGGYFVPYCLR